MAARVPKNRIRLLRDDPPRAAGRYVLYWMIAHRRTRSNHALDRALELAKEHDKPLLVFEPLRVAYPHHAVRFHKFILEGMADNAAAFEAAGIRYYPYVEPEVDAGKGLLAALAAAATCVVTDDPPTFHYPEMLDAASDQVEVHFESVDANGLLPMRLSDRAFPTTHGFRGFLHDHVVECLKSSPRKRPLAAGAPTGDKAVIPREILSQWPPVGPAVLEDPVPYLAGLPIDQAVAGVEDEGGSRAGQRLLRRFLDTRLSRYPGERNEPDAYATSELSPHLHFGHIGTHEVLDKLLAGTAWSPRKIDRSRRRARAGWWGLDTAREAFLDQVVTWREVGHQTAAMVYEHREFESLPEWARNTLEAHASDDRAPCYDLAAFEAAVTHDEVWNAAQRQLVREGRVHNYLRMVWGKGILAWSSSPREALRTMIHLNDKYALDGRDPNSYSGIFWVLGRFDRAWGPERKVFGKIRYMTSANTKRKLDLKGYLERYGPTEEYIEAAGPVFRQAPST